MEVLEEAVALPDYSEQSLLKDEILAPSEHGDSQAVSEGSEAAGRRRGNPLWKKGESGNPMGRPVGSKNRLTLLREAVIAEAEELVLDNWAALVAKTIELAQNGDTTCLKILWDRIIPAKKAIDGIHRDSSEFGVKIVIQSLEPKSVIIEGEVNEVE